MSLDITFIKYTDDLSGITSGKFGLEAPAPHYVGDVNITHNLCRMAREVGVYHVLWEGNDLQAKYIIRPILKALAELVEHPEVYDKFDSPNGWGTREHFVVFLADTLRIAVEHPESVLEVSR